MGSGNYPEPTMFSKGLVHIGLQHANTFIALSKRLALTLKVAGVSFSKYDDFTNNPGIKLVHNIMYGTGPMGSHPGMASDYDKLGMDFTRGSMMHEAG